MEYEDESYSSRILQELKKLKQCNQLCDVTLEISGKQFPAHKNILSASSPFFQAMFNGEIITNSFHHDSLFIDINIVNERIFVGFFPESSQNIITLNGIEAEAFESTLDYIYTGFLLITKNNVNHILSTACFLQLDNIKIQCCIFMENILNSENCIEIFSLADKYSCLELLERSKDCIVDNFVEVSRRKEFLKLPFENLELILHDDKIYPLNDNVILSIIIPWINYNFDSRKEYFCKFEQFFRPILISRNFLCSLKDNFADLKENQNFLDFLEKKSSDKFLKWKVYILGKTGTDSSLVECEIKSKTFLKRKPLPKKIFGVSLTNIGSGNEIEYLLAQGGSVLKVPKNDSYFYNPFYNQWAYFTPLQVPRSCHRSCFLNGFLYAIGGTTVDGPTRNVESVDASDCRPFNVNSMIEERSSLGAVKQENCLYVMGGLNLYKTLYSVERYDPRVGSWEELTSMTRVNGYCSSAIIGNHIYCSEGLAECMERYDVRANKWEQIEFKDTMEILEIFSVQNELYAGFENGIYEFQIEKGQWTTVLNYPELRSWDAIIPVQLSAFNCEEESYNFE